MIGPVIRRATPKRQVFDVAPFFFTIRGKPETGGVRESHTTLFPFFHYGYAEDRIALRPPRLPPPGDARRPTRSSRRSEPRDDAQRLDVADGCSGRSLPLYYGYRDTDVGYHATRHLRRSTSGRGSPTGRSVLTPLFGQFETYGVSRTYWVFPNVTVTSDLHGWETDVHPLVYLGRDEDTSHTVLAPVFWDFASTRGRTTIGFPVFWRFADTADQSVTQVAGNTLYLQKQAPGGLDWQFHLLPLFSYGENPTGYWWNILFGLAGYDRAGSYARIKAFWIPITVSGAPGTALTAH